MLLVIYIYSLLAEASPLPSAWEEILKWAAGTGIGGVMLVLIAKYFKNENEKLIVKLEAEQAARLLVIENENKAKINILTEQNKACVDDRAVLHTKVEAMQEKLDKMKDQIIEIHKSRYDRLLVESLKLVPEENLPKKKQDL